MAKDSRIYNDIDMPIELFEAIIKNWYGGGNLTYNYSVTELINDPTEIYLQQKYKDFIKIPASSRIPALIGSAVHHILEVANKNESLRDISDIFTNTIEGHIYNNKTPNITKFRNELKTKLKALIDSPKFLELAKQFYSNKNFAKYIAERRFYYKLDGKYTISGGVDIISITDNAIKDYKFTKVSSYLYLQDKEEHYSKQLSSYKLLLRNSGFDLLNYDTIKLVIIMIFSDWNRSRYLKNPDAYTPAVKAVEVPLIPENIILDEWRNKINIVEDYKAKNIKDNELPPCSPKERWESSGTWAVYYPIIKGRNTIDMAKRPRTFATEELAINFIENDSFLKAKKFVDRANQLDSAAIENVQNNLKSYYSKEYRGGIPIKCAYYCSVKEFCPFYNKNKEKFQ